MKARWIGTLAFGMLALGACAQATAERHRPAAPAPVTPEDAGLAATPTAPEGDPPPRGAQLEFRTDFSRHSVPYAEILSGGPPKDGIPALDDPKFITVEQAGDWLEPLEPVIVVQAGGEARAYPVQVLIWHEIVNDTVGGLPLAITFCPLCNTAIVFERRAGERVLDFGTTGRLRHSNLIMYDRQTETWWQQGTGEAIVGELLGERLAFHPAGMLGWADFAARFPDGLVLSSDTGYDRPYGRNPYAGYDNIESSPFLFDGETPDRLRAMERVLALELEGETVAYAYSDLSQAGVVNDVVGGEPVVVFWAPGTASPLDAGAVAAGRDVGSAHAFSPRHAGDVLAFRFEDGRIVDGSGSAWNLFGEAVSGPLQGVALQPLPGINHFWFDWVAFRPETRVWAP